MASFEWRPKPELEPSEKKKKILQVSFSKTDLVAFLWKSFTHTSILIKNIIGNIRLYARNILVKETQGLAITSISKKPNYSLWGEKQKFWNKQQEKQSVILTCDI